MQPTHQDPRLCYALPVGETTMAVHVAADFAVPDKGAMLLVIHGASNDSRNMLDVHRAFNPQIMTACVDLPGHGASPGDGAYKLDAMAERIRGLIKTHFADKRIGIIGESAGALVALKLGKLTLDEVVGVVAVDPPLSTKKLWQMQIPLFQYGQDHTEFFRQFIFDLFGYQLRGDFEERLYYDHVRDLTKPTMLITGDPMPAPPRASSTWYCLMDEVDRYVLGLDKEPLRLLEQIPGGNHTLLHDRLETCTSLIMDFWRKQLIAATGA